MDFSVRKVTNYKSSLVQVMACCIFSTKSLFEPVLAYCQLDHGEQTSVKFELKKSNIFTKNGFENVICRRAAILSQPQ